jgi:DNA-binding GntR family transcriptional regulator
MGLSILARISGSAAALPSGGQDASPFEGSGILALCEDWSPDLQKTRAYEQILLDIILGVLPPNARLEEQALVRRYGIGLAGVRDALGRLALEGLVVRRARSGTTVCALDLVELGNALEVRGLLEPHCAAQAAANATPEDIEQIVHAFDDGEAAVRARNSRSLVAMDQRFHSSMARASRNETLARILIPLQHKAARYWVYTMGADTEEERLAEVERHRILAARIAERDGEGARLAAMRILKIFPAVRRVVR